VVAGCGHVSGKEGGVVKEARRSEMTRKGFEGRPNKTGPDANVTGRALKEINGKDGNGQRVEP